jgi:hypothetical protein
MESLFHELLDVLEVTHHSFLENFPSVSDANLVRHLASDLVDDDRNSANPSIPSFASASGVSAVQLQSGNFKSIDGLNSVG